MCHAEWLIAEFPHQGAKSIIISYPQICAAQSQGWKNGVGGGEKRGGKKEQKKLIGG